MKRNVNRFGVVRITLAGVLWAAPVVAQDIASVVRQEAPGLQQHSDQTPVIKADVRLVTLDVIVTDEKGNTVQGLKQSDFKLLEDGTAQRLANFEAHSRPLQPVVRQKLPANTFSDLGPGEESSAMVLMLDVLDSPTVTDQMYVRQEMIAYMKTVPEGTRIAIVQLDTGLHLIQGFTSDREELLAAVMSKRDFPRFSPVHEPCAEQVHPMAILGLPSITAAAGVPDPCDANAPGAERLAALVNPYGQQNAALRKGVLGHAVPQLTNYLSGFPGRKNLIWFYSQSTPIETFNIGMKAMFADQTNFVAEMGRTTHLLTLNQIALTLVNTTADKNVLSPEDGTLQKTLRAEGGDLVANDNFLKQVIQRVEDKAWNYYTLSYSPSDPHFDGKFRRLEVQLQQRGLTLQYRRGYYAMNDAGRRLGAMEAGPEGGAATAGGESDATQAAMGMGAATPRDIRFLVHVDPAAVSKGSAKGATNFLVARYRKDDIREYRLRYTVETKSLGLMPGSDGVYRGRVEFVCMVYDDQGSTVNSVVLRASVHADARSYAALLKDGLEMTQSIAVPDKGNFFLRLGVHDVSADRMGVVEVPVGEIKIGVAEQAKR